MSYYLKLFDWSLYTLPTAIPLTDIEGDTHSNDPASPDYWNGAPTWIGEDFTFDGGIPYQILVDDDDGHFEDGYVETGGIQTLAQDVTINGTLYAAGSQVENEFSMLDSLGNEVWVLRIGGKNVGFVYPTGQEPTAVKPSQRRTGAMEIQLTALTVWDQGKPTIRLTHEMARLRGQPVMIPSMQPTPGIQKAIRSMMVGLAEPAQTTTMSMRWMEMTSLMLD